MFRKNTSQLGGENIHANMIALKSRFVLELDYVKVFWTVYLNRVNAGSIHASIFQVEFDSFDVDDDVRNGIILGRSVYFFARDHAVNTLPNKQFDLEELLLFFGKQGRFNLQ